MAIHEAFREELEEPRPWERIVEIAPEARRWEDLVYMNFDVIEGFIDLAKALTEYEKGGFFCGDVVFGHKVGWAGADVVRYYDSISCRNVAPNPKKSYLPAEECKQRVRRVYKTSSSFHTHPSNRPPSPSDWSSLAKYRHKYHFLVTPDYFVVYGVRVSFTVLFDTGRYDRSEHLEKVPEHRPSLEEYVEEIRKELPHLVGKFRILITTHRKIRKGIKLET